MVDNPRRDMRLVVDLDRLELITSETDACRLTQIERKRGDAAETEIIFLRSGVRQEHATGTVVKFAAKEDGKYDSDPIIFEDGFVLTDTGAEPYYLASPSFNTVPLNALLFVDEDLGNDKKFVDLIGEISWGIPADAAPTSTKTFRVRVFNDVIRDDEGAPTTLPAPDDFVAARAVLYDRAQTLTIEEQLRVQTSIGIVDIDGNLVVNGIVIRRLTLAEWNADTPQIPALDELIVSPTGKLLKGDGVLPGRELPLLTSVTNPFTTIRAGDTAEVRAAENWKVFGDIVIEEGAFIEIEDGGTVQILTA